MRRNNITRGNPSGSNPTMGSISSHLHDLDLELELLKRKRELFEQQQQITPHNSFGNQRMLDYDQPQQEFYDDQQYNNNPMQQFKTNRSFSHLYDEGPKSSNFGRQGTKRPNPVPIWESNDTPPKRFNDSQRGNPRDRGTHRPNRDSKSPRLDFIERPKPFEREQNLTQRKPLRPNPRKRNSTRTQNWRLSKIAKQQPPPLIPKLISRPVSERKDIVSAVTKSSGDVASYILRADMVPTNIMTGRLELGLGHIMKQIKDNYEGKTPVHKYEFIHQNRNLKQAVRERMRQAMLGKFVGQANEVVAHYRAMFPVETDKDMVAHALDPTKPKPADPTKPKPTNSTKPKSTGKTLEPEKEYYKVNMQNLLIQTLNEMFSKLEGFYKDSARPMKEIIQELETKHGVKDNMGRLKNNTYVIDINSFGSTTIIIDPDTVSNDEGGTSEVAKKDNVAAAKAGKDSVKDANGEDGEAVSDLDKQNKDTEETKSGDKQTNKPDEYEAHIAYYNELMKRFLEVKLPQAMYKVKDDIIRALDVHRMFNQTKAEIFLKANELIKNEEPQVKVVKTKPKPPAKQPTENPNCVKITGVPYLPKRKLMQSFLDQFSPIYVKKHKLIGNLLFVQVPNKVELENILAYNGSVVDKSQLSIAVSDKLPNKEKASSVATNSEVVVVEDDDPKATNSANDSTLSDDKLISSDLDNQITDLLSAIRKTEEEEEVKKMNVELEAETESQTNDNANSKLGSVDNDSTVSKPDLVVEAVRNEDAVKSAEFCSETNPGITDDNDVEIVDTENNDDNKDSDENSKDEEANEVEKEDIEDEKEDIEDEKEDIEDEKEDIENKDENNEAAAEIDKGPVPVVKNVSGRATPSRASSRLANTTPSTIRTRRASRLGN